MSEGTRCLAARRASRSSRATEPGSAARPVTPSSEGVAGTRAARDSRGVKPPAGGGAAEQVQDGPSPRRPSDAASQAARTGEGRWARSRLIGGHRRRRRWAPRKDSTRRHGVGAAGPRPARSGRSGGCARTVTPSSRKVTSAQAEPDRVVVKGRRRSAPLPWRRPFTLASPAAQSTPLRLLEAHGVIRGVAPVASAASTPQCSSSSPTSPAPSSRPRRTPHSLHRPPPGEAPDPRGRGPAEYMRPCALDVSRLPVGGEPLVAMAGHVVVAGSTMRSEERGA